VAEKKSGAAGKPKKITPNGREEIISGNRDEKRGGEEKSPGGREEKGGEEEKRERARKTGVLAVENRERQKKRVGTKRSSWYRRTGRGSREERQDMN
jgi:hypothetical protein